MRRSVNRVYGAAEDDLEVVDAIELLEDEAPKPTMAFMEEPKPKIRRPSRDLGIHIHASTAAEVKATTPVLVPAVLQREGSTGHITLIERYRQGSFSAARRASKHLEVTALLPGQTEQKSTKQTSSVFAQRCRDFLSHRAYNTILVIAVVLTVIGDDFVALVFPKAVDRAYSGLVLLCFFFFLSDFTLRFVVQRLNYVLSIYGILDIIATVSLVPSFLPVFSITTAASTSALAITRLGRVSKAASRVVKFVRLISQLAASRHRDSDTGEVISASRAGQQLNARILRDVVIGVLFLFFFQMGFDYLRAVNSLPQSDVFAAQALQAARTPAEMEFVFAQVKKIFGSQVIKLCLYNGTCPILNQWAVDNLRAGEEIVAIDEDSKLILDVTKDTKLNAGVNIMYSVVLFFLLAAGLYMFTQQAERIFVKPVEKMLASLARLEQDPTLGPEAAELRTADETSVLVKAWNKVLQSLAEQTQAAVTNADALAAATEVTSTTVTYIADMDLDGAEEVLRTSQLQSVSTELYSSLQRIVHSLREFKPYLPDTIFKMHFENDDNDDISSVMSDSEEIATPYKENSGILKDPSSRVASRLSLKHSSSFSESMRVDMSTKVNSMSSKPAWAEAKSLEEQAKPDRLHVRSVTILNCYLEGLQSEIFDLCENVDAIQSEMPSESQEVVDQIATKFLNITVSEIKRQRGHVFDFSLDRIQAVWNAVQPCAAHTIMATACALALRDQVQKMLEELQGSPNASVSGVASRIQVQCVVHCDSQVVGNIGTAALRKFAVFGCINEQTRLLMQLNRILCTSVLATSQVYSGVETHFDIRPVDIIRFPTGEHSEDTMEPVKVYEVLQESKRKADEWMYQLKEENKRLKTFESAFSDFAGLHWQKAIGVLNNDVRASTDLLHSSSSLPSLNASVDTSKQRLINICTRLSEVGVADGCPSQIASLAEGLFRELQQCAGNGGYVRALRSPWAVMPGELSNKSHTKRILGI